MALEAHSPGNTEARDELLQYCRENDLFFPHQDYPFHWPQHISRPSSPLPDIPDCFGSHNLIADESLQYEGPSQAYLNEILTIGRVEDDIYDIRCLTHYQIELPLLLPTAATDKLRKFGPDTLQRCVASISRIPLKDDNGLDMPKDESTIFSATSKDAKLLITEEEAAYFKKVISEYNTPEGSDIILDKVFFS